MRIAGLAAAIALGGAGSALAAAADPGLTVDFGAAPLPLPPPPAAGQARPAAPTPAAPGVPAAPGASGATSQAAPIPPPPPPPPPAIRYTAADLSVQPTPQQIINAYPPAGRAMGVRARVLMNCQVAEDGALHDCAVADVSSRGGGFDQAALKLAPLYRMRPKGAGEASLTIVFSPDALKDAGGRF